MGGRRRRRRFSGLGARLLVAGANSNTTIWRCFISKTGGLTLSLSVAANTTRVRCGGSPFVSTLSSEPVPGGESGIGILECHVRPAPSTGGHAGFLAQAGRLSPLRAALEHHALRELPKYPCGQAGP